MLGQAVRELERMELRFLNASKETWEAYGLWLSPSGQNTTWDEFLISQDLNTNHNFFDNLE